jgi:hypothetical protein
MWGSYREDKLFSLQCYLLFLGMVHLFLPAFHRGTHLGASHRWTFDVFLDLSSFTLLFGLVARIRMSVRL